MTVINFYFSSDEKWIEYSLDNNITKVFFETANELREFIKENNLNLTYEGCFNC